jgi:peroxin-6
MQRLAMLKDLLRDSAIGIDVSLENVATQTAALVAGDLANLVSLAHIAASERILELRCAPSQVLSSNPDIDSRKLNIPPEDAKFAGYSMLAIDFERALGQARASFSASIGAPSIPKVSWDDVGGLVSVKADILDTIQLPLQHPEVFSDGMKKRSGAYH